uniref:Secreted protein n=1 Tax=Salix viminalis TaxID=40686 RepID=A0A6N2KKW6_SALVM
MVCHCNFLLLFCFLMITSTPLVPDHLLFYFTCFFNFSPEYVNFYLICFATDKKKCNYVYEIIFNRHMDLIAESLLLYRTQNMVVKEFPKLFKVMQLKKLSAIIQENSIKRLMYAFLDSILVLFSG